MKYPEYLCLGDGRAQREHLRGRQAGGAPRASRPAPRRAPRAPTRAQAQRAQATQHPRRAQAQRQQDAGRRRRQGQDNRAAIPRGRPQNIRPQAQPHAVEAPPRPLLVLVQRRRRELGRGRRPAPPPLPRAAPAPPQEDPPQDRLVASTVVHTRAAFSCHRRRPMDAVLS